MKQQKVVRTYTPGYGCCNDIKSTESLNDLLQSGWSVVMRNTVTRADGEQWLEYIVEKEFKKWRRKKRLKY